MTFGSLRKSEYLPELVVCSQVDTEEGIVSDGAQEGTARGATDPCPVQTGLFFLTWFQ